MQPYYLARVTGPSTTMTLTTTLTNVAGVSVNLAPGGWYLINAWGQFTTTATSATVGVTLNGTVSTVAPTAYSVRIRNGTNDGANTQVSQTIPGAATPSNPISTTGTYAFVIDGLVVAGTTGGTVTVAAKISATGATIAANNVTMLVQQIT